MSNDNSSTRRNVQIRLASLADRADMCQLVVTNHLALSEDCPVEWMEQCREVVDDYCHLFNQDKFALAWYRVAEETSRIDDDQEKQILGVAGLMPSDSLKRNNNTWHVTAVSVRQGNRRGGIGEQLLTALLADAREVMGIQRLELETLLEIMEPAWRLYEKMGFQRKSERIAFHASRDRPRPMTVLHYTLDL